MGDIMIFSCWETLTTQVFYCLWVNILKHTTLQRLWHIILRTKNLSTQLFSFLFLDDTLACLFSYLYSSLKLSFFYHFFYHCHPLQQPVVMTLSKCIWYCTLITFLSNGIKGDLSFCIFSFFFHLTFLFTFQTSNVVLSFFVL